MVLCQPPWSASGPGKYAAFWPYARSRTSVNRGTGISGTVDYRRAESASRIKASRKHGQYKTRALVTYELLSRKICASFYANNDLIVEERKVVQSTQIWRQTFFFRELEVMDISALCAIRLGRSITNGQTNWPTSLSLNVDGEDGVAGEWGSPIDRSQSVTSCW